MNQRQQAHQALRYLSSLNQPLPSESDTEFYQQNRRDYLALLALNKKGLGSTEDELKKLAGAALSTAEVKKIAKRIIKIDALIVSEYGKKDKIEATPCYWNGYFSGREASPTSRCKQLLKGIDSRIEKLSDEQSSLFLLITKKQALEYGCCCDCMDEEDFKQAI